MLRPMPKARSCVRPMLVLRESVQAPCWPLLTRSSGMALERMCACLVGPTVCPT